MKFKFKEFRIPLYTGRLAVCLVDEAGTAKMNKRYNLNIESGSWAGAARGYIDDKRVVVVHFNLWDKGYPMTYGAISHEAFHASSYILSYAGHEADHENNEPHAYLLGWITGCIVSVLKSYSMLSKLSVGVI